MDRDKTVSVGQAIARLNRLVKADADAMFRLCNARVECNEDVALDETARTCMWAGPGKRTIGLIGVLNAIFGEPECEHGPIGALFTQACPSGHTPEDAHGNWPKDEDGDTTCGCCGEKCVYNGLHSFAFNPGLPSLSSVPWSEVEDISDGGE